MEIIAVHTIPLQSLLTAGLLTGTLALGLLSPRLAHGAATPTAHAAAPCMPAGYGTPGATPVIVFGHQGGNFRPSRVAIYSDGTITYQGGTPLSTSFKILPPAVRGLERLAQAEGFSTLPPLIKSPHWLPDFGNFFITVRAGCSGTLTTVRAQGNVGGGFTELYDTLTAATAMQG